MQRRAPLILVEGFTAAQVGFASFDGSYALVWLLTGIALLGSGLVTAVQVPTTRTGPLLVAAAAAWYLGAFRLVGIEPLAALAERGGFPLRGGARPCDRVVPVGTDR